MWSAEELARESIGRQSPGLSAAQVTEKVTEASRREQETQQQLVGVPVDRGPYATDPEELAQLWVARHTEWRRIAALMEAGGWKTYDPEQDAQGRDWARERSARRQGSLDRHAARVQERRDTKDELRAQI